ncbi:MAG: outer membrane lipoprotein-sorting protein [Methanoculleus sp.]|nr:outer membrane lipoprotein-sorting protein [Methanoculleus sp.]
MIHKYLLPVILFALIAGSGCTDVWNTEATGDDIVDQFTARQESIRDYSAVLSKTTGLTIEAPVLETMNITVKKPYCYRVEYLVSPKVGVGTLAVSDGRDLWWYYPSENRYQHRSIDDPTQTIFTELDYQTTASTILKENEPTYIGEDVIDGEMAYVIEAMPDDPLKYSPVLFSRVRIWIDSDSWVVKKIEFFYESEIPIVRAEYSIIRINTEVSSDVCTFVPPEGAEPEATQETGRITPLRAGTPQQAQERFGSYIRIPAYVPEGYTFHYALFYEGEAGQTSQIYTMGDDELRIIEISPPDKPCPEIQVGDAMQVMIDGTEGTYVSGEGRNQLRWRDENLSYCITGAPGEDEMMMIAASIG